MKSVIAYTVLLSVFAQAQTQTHLVPMAFESSRNADYFAVLPDGQVTLTGAQKTINVTNQDGVIKGSYKNCHEAYHVHENPSGLLQPYSYGYEMPAGCEPLKKFSFRISTGKLDYYEKNSFGFWSKGFTEELRQVSMDQLQQDLQQNKLAK